MCKNDSASTGTPPSTAGSATATPDFAELLAAPAGPDVIRALTVIDPYELSGRTGWCCWRSRSPSRTAEEQHAIVARTRTVEMYPEPDAMATISTGRPRTRPPRSWKP